MNISNKQSRVHCCEWRSKIGAIGTQMVFEAMGLGEIALFKPHIIQCPHPGYLRGITLIY